MSNRVYSDIDFGFAPHPITGDIAAKYDVESVKQSVKNLLKTRFGERPFRSNIGSNLYALLFEPALPSTAIIMQTEIANVINNFEPRVYDVYVDVQFSPDQYYANVTIAMKIKFIDEPVKFSLKLKRTR